MAKKTNNKLTNTKNVVKKKNNNNSRTIKTKKENKANENECFINKITNRFKVKDDAICNDNSFLKRIYSFDKYIFELLIAIFC